MKDEKIKARYKAVMLIDDNNIDNFINEKIIKTSGFAVNVYKHTSIASGLEFLKNMETIKRFFSDIIPEVIFLDINLPILDGFQFLEEFERFSSELKERIKIVILTSSINPSDVEKAKTYERVVNYHSKPLLAKDLKNILSLEIYKE